MQYLRIKINGSACTVPVDEIELLIRELRGLAGYAYPTAAGTATIFEAAVADEIAADDFALNSDEDESLSRALHGLEVEQRLPDGLRCIWNAIRDRATPAD